VQWFWHQHRFATVAAHIPAGTQSIIDIGCGPGTFLGNFGTSIPRALGVDIAAAQIEYARRHYQRPGLEYRAADASRLQGGELFDVAVSIEVIEHLTPTDAASFLARLCELVRPGGGVVLTTPNYRSLWPLWEALVSRIGPVDYRPQHINRFTAERLTGELRQAGFVDVRCQTFFVAAPFLAAASRGAAERLLGWELRRLRPWGAELVVSGRRPD
jgi:2-polyprenyl-3-methyl-5-hydroxy-6-metoxy-1,4-benzoquinol methylase